MSISSKEFSESISQNYRFLYFDTECTWFINYKSLHVIGSENITSKSSLFNTFFAGRVGTCVHGHLHSRNGGQNLGWWFYFTQRKLPQKSLEYHGFYRCRIWVRIISKWAKNHLSTFPKIFRLNIFLTFPACF